MRKSGLRKMSLVMASVLVMGSLAACQSSGGSETPAAEATAAENSQSEAAPAEGKRESFPGMWASRRAMCGARFPMILRRKLRKEPEAA